MADGGVDIDLYADDIESDFNRQDEFGGGDNVDLYDDVISAPNVKIEDGEGPPSGQQHSHSSEETNGNSGYHNGPHHGHHGGRRVQLYVGNLTWWATDQDIANAVADIGVNDFQDVRFFENRTNGQSKGFCVITLGSEHSLRIVMERLPKKELHGQHPVVTLPTKQALNQFESQSKTRATPPGPNQGMMRGPHPQGPPGPHPDFYNGPNGPGPNGPPGRMMMPPGGPHHGMRGPPPGGPPHHMQHPGGPGGPPHHMQHPGPPPGHQGPPPGHQGPPHRPPPQFGGGMQQRPMGPGMGRGGGDWGPRPPHMQQPGPPQYHPPPPHHHMPPQHPQHPQHQQHPQHPQHPQHQQHPQHHPGGGMPPPHHGMPPHAQGPPRAPHPGMNNGYPGPGGPPGGPPAPAPHVNPAFFSQQPPVQPQPQPQQQPPPGPGVGYGHGPPPAQALPQAARPQPYGRPPQGYGVVEAGAAVGLGPGGAVPVGGPPRPAPPHVPVVSEAEFEEVMGRNRTVSSSAIARAVSDAAAGEYASAIETLVTAISLIKQSKVAHDDRCKILISSLQDTLHGVESKSYSAGGRRERGTERSDRSRSRERERERERHRRAEPRRRERSASRYRERSRERERDREDRDRYYRDYRERERTRSRERERATDHYPRGHSREERPRKSPVEPVAEAGGGDAPTSKSRSAPYYDERYRERRERETTATDRDREREHRREARH